MLDFEMDDSNFKEIHRDTSYYARNLSWYYILELQRDLNDTEEELNLINIQISDLIDRQQHLLAKQQNLSKLMKEINSTNSRTSNSTQRDLENEGNIQGNINNYVSPFSWKFWSRQNLKKLDLNVSCEDL